MNIGESKRFNATGGMQSFTIPQDGIYKLEVWGSKGSGYNNNGGNGGYSVGWKSLKKGTVLYICCGSNSGNQNAGYNGGGYGSWYEPWASKVGAGGGGATHIALVTGTLASIGYTSFVTRGNGLIVAGGGGGGTSANGGGSGGGTTGGSSGGGGGGTQTSGGTCNYSSSYAGSFGKGGNAAGVFTTEGGGGGGFYGGGMGTSGSGGGSGWIGGVPAFRTYTPSTSNGVNSGTGYAIITLVANSFPELKLGDTTIVGMVLGDIEIEGLAVGDIVLG